MASKIFEFVVPGFSIPFSNLYLTDTLRLNQFQKDLYDFINNGRDVLAVAPPGSGKTLTLLLNSKPLGTLRGFVALYPNNTLLKNQMKTVEDVLKEHFKADLEFTTNKCEPGDVECIEPLRIYRIDPSVTRDAWGGDKHVALLALSSKAIQAIQSEPGVPKREILYKLGEKVLSYGNEDIYVIVFSTIDTYLLVSTGAYTNFESVGKAVHNILLAIARGEPRERIDDILRKTKTLTRSKVEETVSTYLSLLDVPLFIDEFHLYDPYDVDALYVLLRLHRELKQGLPVVFSSATPAEDIIGGLSDVVKPAKIEARTVAGGSGFQVKGDMHVIVISVATKNKGMPAFYGTIDLVPKIVESDNEMLQVLKSIDDGRALIIVDRLWMVAHLARRLREKGIDVECIASIVPEDICKKGSNVIVGSETTTQGVNLGKVVLGIMSGTSSEDVIQRVGRVGRRGVNSTLYLIAPESALEEAEGDVKSKMTYGEFANWICKVYPDYHKRKKSVSNILNRYFPEISDVRRKLIYSLGIVAIARVSGMSSVLDKINLTRDEAINILNTVITSPEMITRLMLFRRSGFNVYYIVEEYKKEDVSSIGLITRNFAIKDVKKKDVKKGRLIIRLDPARSKLAIVAEKDPSHIAGRIVDLRTLLRLLNAYISIDNDRIRIEGSELIENALTYIFDTGVELADYLSYTGEGAEIISFLGGLQGDLRYAVIFI